MIRNCLFIMMCFLLPFSGFAQQHLLQGKVTNTKLEPLGFVTVQLKNQKLGTRTNDKGEYLFKLEEGDYDLVISLVGYKTKTLKVVLQKGGTIQNFILEENNKDLGEVKVVASKKDRAEEIIKQVIKNRENNIKEVSSFGCQVYIKATEEEITTLTERQKNKRNKKKNDAVVITDSLRKINQLDSIRKAKAAEMSKMSMAEIFMNLNYEYPGKIKEERTGVKKRGNTEGLFYLSTTEGDFSLYQNLIRVNALSETPFLSPISYSGLVGYKFKTIKVDKKSKCNIYTIKFTPIKAGNALIEGEVEIVDTSWAIINAIYNFPNHLMGEYDFFQAEISYEVIQNKSWMLDRMELSYYSKNGKSKSNGNTVVVFDQYKFDTTFSKRYFSTELSTTTLEAYDRDSNFWNKVRKEPLTEKELTYIRYKDSVYDYTHTKAYLDSIDKRNNKITWEDVLIDGIDFFKRENERYIFLYPIAFIPRPLYPGGSRLAYGGSISKIPKNKKTYSLSADLAYGLKMKDLVGFLKGFYRYNPFSQGYIDADVGRNYDLIFANDSYINILRRSNFFLKDYINFEHGVELINGLVLRNKFEFSLRKPVTLGDRDTSFDRFFGSLGSDSAIYRPFEPYNALYGNIVLEYTPKQMYMREPRQKVILGSKYPTFYVQWRKGIPNVFGSVIDFDYVEFGFRQRLKLGLLGISDYKFSSGTFLRQKNLQTIDFKFIRRGDPIFFTSPGNNFQSLDSSFALFKRFYEAHYLHEFYGALINKVPYAKYLKLYEIAGGGSLYAPERKLIYFEAFVGLEKSFKLLQQKFKIGGYFVASVANKENRPFQFKIGLQNYNEVRNRWE